jgi:transaldolase
MKLFIDSSDPKEIQTAREWGIIDGVTTNPSLIAKAGTEMETTLASVLEVSPGPVFCQAVGWKEVEPLKAQARWLYKQSDRIIVKLPISVAGVTAVSQLKKEIPDIQLAVTAVSTVAQAVLVAKSGADVIAVFNGPLDLEQDEPVNVVPPIRTFLDRNGYKCRLLSAGRFPRTFGECAAGGTDIITIRMEYLRLLFEHSFTDKRMRGFLGDWQNTFGDKVWPTA